jgi:4-alpha-glucanotransferase
MPGTTDQWPNWSLALPSPLEDVETDATVKAVAEALNSDR